MFLKQSFKLVYIFLIILFASCSKDDDDNVVPTIEDLSNARIETVTIINVPPYFWDNGSSPDLELRLAKKSSTSWTYITNRVYNVEAVPQILIFSDRIDITNELWELELIDHDDLNQDDVIYRIEFNPHALASNGIIPIHASNQLLVMEFNYTR